MSLKEAYTLAHTAQCRLNIAASRPDRNLRFVVGHLMHYEHLRLRIVEIEHDISKSQRAKAVQFQGTGHVVQQHGLQHKVSTGQLGRKSPPPVVTHVTEFEDDDDDDDEEFDDEVAGLEDDEEDGGLGLTRFPSGTAHPPRAPPDLEPDEEGDDDEDEPVSPPEEPDQATLQQAIQGDGNELLATMYEGVRKCICHGKTAALSFDRMWELPQKEGGKGKEGVTWAVAEIRVGDSV